MTPQWAEVDFISEASRALDHDITVLVGSIPQLHPEYSWQSDYVIDPSVLIDTLAGTPGPLVAMPRPPRHQMCQLAPPPNKGCGPPCSGAGAAPGSARFERPCLASCDIGSSLPGLRSGSRAGSHDTRLNQDRYMTDPVVTFVNANDSA